MTGSGPSASEIREAFESAGIFDCHESDVTHRLLYTDKVAILKAVKEHGKQALTEITKGDSKFYCRESGEVSGPDSEFLSDVFLSQAPAEDKAILRYTGPNKILIFISEKAFASRGVLVVDSYSPFEDRAAYQKPYKDDVIAGYKFCATVQRRVPAHILRMHGRIERCTIPRLPKIIKDRSQGIWTATTLGGSIFSGGGQMASEIGPIPANGGDYLRYLLLLGAINGAKIHIGERTKLLLYVDHIFGADGHCLGSFPRRFV